MIGLFCGICNYVNCGQRLPYSSATLPPTQGLPTVATITINRPPCEHDRAEGDEATFDAVILPNLSTGIIHIEFKNGSDADKLIEMFDMKGRLCLTTSAPINASEVKINGMNLFSGIYQLRITCGSKIISKKIVFAK